MKCLAAVIATAIVTLAAPSLAQAATLVADPDLSCYPEGFQVFLPGEGFTPGAQVNFTRDGQLLPADPPILADQAGAISANLTLPGLLKGQDTLDYVATDAANPANTAALSLLVTATDINLDPEQGAPERLLTIRARGFFGGGKRLWAHVVRQGGQPVAQREGRAHQGPVQEGQGQATALLGRRPFREVPRPVRRVQALPQEAGFQADLQRHHHPHRGAGHRVGRIGRVGLEADRLTGPARGQRERPAAGVAPDRQRHPLDGPAAAPLDAVAPA